MLPLPIYLPGYREGADALFRACQARLFSLFSTAGSNNHLARTPFSCLLTLCPLLPPSVVSASPNLRCIMVSFHPRCLPKCLVESLSLHLPSLHSPYTISIPLFDAFCWIKKKPWLFNFSDRISFGKSEKFSLVSTSTSPRTHIFHLSSI